MAYKKGRGGGEAQTMRLFSAIRRPPLLPSSPCPSDSYLQEQPPRLGRRAQVIVDPPFPRSPVPRSVMWREDPSQ